MDFIELKGAKVPVLGLGTWQADGGECYRAVLEGLAIGYRHVDTAQIYGNEAEVGEGIKDSGVRRESIWLTTKVWTDAFTKDALAPSVEKSLKKLGTDYVDLLLLHWPQPAVPLAESIGALLAVQQAGKAKHIGVSNFNTAQMEQAQKLAGGRLITNQVEYHPFLNQNKVLAAAREQGMFVTAYSPLARGLVVENAVIHKIAAEREKTPAQITLRWLVQQGVVAIPKTVTPERLKENLAIFDFKLSDTDMADINLLRGNKRLVLPKLGHWDSIG